MRLASFSFEDRERVGVIVDDEVVDLYLAAPDAPTDMCEFLAAGAEARVMAEMAVERGGNRRPLSEVQLLAPVTETEQVPRRGPELCGPHRRDRLRDAALPDDLHQAAHLREQSRGAASRSRWRRRQSTTRASWVW